jgi:predicted  nucleic acid-binding Zn-ribbon protein
MKQCKKCGKELPGAWSTDKCLECSRKAIREIFKEYPEAKQAFKESVAEMKKPEHMDAMANNTVDFMRAIQKAQKTEKRRGLWE